MNREPVRWLHDDPHGEDDWSDLPVATRAPRVSVLTRGLALGLLILAAGLAIAVEWADRRNASEVASSRAILSAEEGVISATAFSADGRTLAAARANGLLSLWDVESRKRLGEIVLASNAWKIAFSPDGRTLATLDEGPTILLWDTRSGKALPALELRDQRLASIAFSPDGHTLAAGSCEGHVAFWNLAASRIPKVRPGHRGTTTALAFSPDGRTLASGGRDGAVRLWDAASAEVGKTLGQHASGRRNLDTLVLSLTFSGDGPLLASAASFDPFVRVWDTVAGGQAKALEGQSSPDSFVSFLPGGRALLVADGDVVVRRWDLASGRVEAAFGPLNRGYLRFAAPPDGKTLAIAEGTTLILRDLP